jgi:hypothetical protein
LKPSVGVVVVVWVKSNMSDKYNNRVIFSWSLLVKSSAADAQQVVGCLMIVIMAAGVNVVVCFMWMMNPKRTFMNMAET